jgi:hypothetical protein
MAPMISSSHFVTGTCLLVVSLGTVGGGAVATQPQLDVARQTDDQCSSGSSTCVKATIQKMQRHFEPLARACSHQAIFALAYLRTTQEYARAAAEPGFFADVQFVNHEDAVFAAYYFDAYDAWTANRASQVPKAWAIAFDAAKQRQVSGAGNLLLGMSAHVNRDLPFVLAQLGLGLKADHDKVNVFLKRVVEPLLAELTRRFDPTIDDLDTPYGLSHEVMFKVLTGWRELAWQHAVQLVRAPTPAARALVAAEIEAYAASTARELVTSYRYRPGLSDAAQRDAYCATHG